ncbi:MAG: alpha/beta hydrolase [Marmoricola sp.]
MLPDAVLRYAGHEDAVIDLHLPGGSLPTGAAGRVVVLLHGGFWKVEYDRRHTRPMARALADEGWIVATPEYRRVGGGGGWPVTTEDVLLAVRRLPELLTSLGVDTALASRPPVVTGHSAGGHLALWLATTGLPIEHVVALAPVCDLREAIRLGLGGGATQAFLGGNDPAAADPMVLLADRPATEVAVVHGADDEDVPIELSRRLVAAHSWVSLRVLPGTGHMELVDPGSAAWPTVLGALRSPGIDSP